MDLRAQCGMTTKDRHLDIRLCEIITFDEMEILPLADIQYHSLGVGSVISQIFTTLFEA